MKYMQRGNRAIWSTVTVDVLICFGQSDRQTIIHIPFNFTSVRKRSGWQVRHRAKQERLRLGVGDQAQGQCRQRL
jgi:hypothetical protein